MIPIHLIKQNLEEYKEGALKKNISVDFDQLIKLDTELRQNQQWQQKMQFDRNSIAQVIADISRFRADNNSIVKGLSDGSKAQKATEVFEQVRSSVQKIADDAHASAQKAADDAHASAQKAAEVFEQVHASAQKVVKMFDDMHTSAQKAAEDMHNKVVDSVKVTSQLGTLVKTHLPYFDNHVRDLEQQLREIHLRVPQPPEKNVPLGSSDQDNRELKKVLSPSKNQRRSHQELGEALSLIDFKHAVKLSGSRSYVLTGRGALLEQAILRLAYDHCMNQNYKAMSVPVLVSEACMEGTGYFPTGKDQSYHCEQDRLCLVGTGEVPVCAFYMDQMIRAEDLPLKLFTQTSCFRREAGSYGKDTKGLYRVHQFQKVEQVIIGANCKSLSEGYHAELLANSEDILQSLELPYRVVEVCTGDLGSGAYYKHDIEAWMPSRDSYGETHSCSAFLEYQSRRLKIRYKDSDGRIHYCHTLNNTAIASPRILIPFLEIHQNIAGDDIHIPEALQPYLFGASKLSEIPNSL